MTCLRLLLFLGCCLISFLSFSQEKIERESKVKPSKVPVPAKEWLSDAFEGLRKPKWYLEYSQTGKAYEAKFIWRSDFYSVKFDSLGNLQDVEIEIQQTEIPTEAWESMQRYFSGDFREIRIQKIQCQLIGDQSDMEDFFDENETKGVTIRYEIVFEGKSEAWQVWEALFDEAGLLISVIKVQLRPLDNLVF